MMKSAPPGKFPPEPEYSVYSSVSQSISAAHRLFSDIERLREELFGDGVATEAATAEFMQQGAMTRLVEEAKTMERRAMIAGSNIQEIAARLGVSLKADPVAR